MIRIESGLDKKEMLSLLIGSLANSVSDNNTVDYLKEEVGVSKETIERLMSAESIIDNEVYGDSKKQVDKIIVDMIGQLVKEFEKEN